MSTDPDPTPEPSVQPSSTPDGPQVIPGPTTPEGEPGPDHEGVPFDNRSSNPNSGGDEGLTGDMGISSERTGPEGEEPRDTVVGVGGTGTRGGAVESTDGELDTSPAEWDAVDVSQSDVHPNRPAELDDPDGAPQSGWTSEQNVDRTVGEPSPNPIPDEKSRRSDPDDS